MNSPNADGHSPAGFPHSEISGSKPVSGSPELIAAIHVLRRLWLPRHPPYALCSLALSLRHASSRARDSTGEPRHSLFVLLPLDDTISKRSRIERFVSSAIQLSMSSGEPSSPRRCAKRGNTPKTCGADRDRTDDLRLAKPALSRLSYSPVWHRARVGQGRLELPTSRLSGVRSNHLSYWPSQATA
jgi:hypothetical protein